jgi:hypothetical protein
MILKCESAAENFQDEWFEALSAEADDATVEDLGGYIERYSFGFDLTKGATGKVKGSSDKPTLPASSRWWQFWK